MAKKSSQFHLLDHPLIHHLLTEARDERTQPPRFREVMALIGEFLAVEATRDLPTRRIRIRTPLERYEGRTLQLPITIVPILRAGLGLAAGFHRIMPEAHMGHLGMFRDEKKLSPVSYFEKLPRDAAKGPVFILDPMLATGGSAISAVKVLHGHGCRDVRLLCLVASPQGAARFAKAHPSVPVFAAAMDRQLDERGYILPGLGDAGDRLFGTSD